MGEHKHKSEVKETRATKQANEDERLSDYHPADALRQVTNGPPSALKPAQILALQRTVGNKVVQRMLAEDQPQLSPKDNESSVELAASGESIQRHPSDEASSFRSNLLGVVQSMAIGNLGRSLTNKQANTTLWSVVGELDMESGRLGSRINVLEGKSAEEGQVVVPASGGI